MARKLHECQVGEVVKVYGARHKPYVIHKVTRVSDLDFEGVNAPQTQRTVVTVKGDHALRGDRAAVAAAARDWLATLLA